MESYLRLFPLNLVAFPGEELNLHVFEDRYKQLVGECIEQEVPFGIPSYVHNKIEYGTEVQIIQVEKKYADGRMDIRTKARRVFKVTTLDNPAKGKLYAGGEVTYQENKYDINEADRLRMLELLRDLYGTLHLENEVPVGSGTISFDIAHKIGFSLEEEYELLKLPLESERQAFIIQHLIKSLPLLREIERTKYLIKMNGHFKHFDRLDF